MEWDEGETGGSARGCGERLTVGWWREVSSKVLTQGERRGWRRRCYKPASFTPPPLSRFLSALSSPEYTVKNFVTDVDAQCHNFGNRENCSRCNLPTIGMMKPRRESFS